LNYNLLRKNLVTLFTAVSFGTTAIAAAQNTEQQTMVSPMQTQIFQLRAMGEPVIPVTIPGPNEESEVLALLQAYQQDPSIASLDAIVDLAKTGKAAAYGPSLLLNAGSIYFQRGYFTRAIEAWKSGWLSAKDLSSHEAHTVADANYGELSKMYARLGRMDELESLLQSASDRKLVGPGATLASNSRVGLEGMKTTPELTFKCGPFALCSIREELGLKDPYHQLIQDEASTTRGTSMAQLAALAKKLDMSFVPVQRLGNSEYPMPSVIHWKLGHYAALLRKDGDQYVIKDPTFGHEMHVSRDSLDKESSGYFLADPEKVQPGSIRAVPETVAANVWGKGYTNDNDTDEDDPCKPEGGGSAAECKACPCDLPPQCESGDCPSANPMAQYTFKLSMVSLSIKDTPVRYQPPVGKGIHFTVTYSQRGTNHPTTYDYGNVGPNWYYNWFSVVEDNPTNLNAYIGIKNRGGGKTGYTYETITGAHTKHNRSLSNLERISTSPIVYQRVFSDGSKDVYGHVLSNSGTVRRIMLTESYDSVGNKTTLNYDACHRLVSIEDAAGQLTSIEYDTPSGGSCASASNYLIRSVTDPYGRQAVFNYNANGQLESITDIIGIASSFTYTGNFIDSMTTPYGTTTFEKEPVASATYRYIQATDPSGERERAEFYRDSAEIAAVRNSVPAGFESSWLNYRNVVFWGKRAMKEAYGNWEAAHIYHFLHSQDLQYMSGTLENEKPPYQDRIYYKHPNQTQGNIEGSSRQPIAIGRKVDDGSVLKVQYEYNSKGNVTKSIDPHSRVTRYEYAANGLDLLKIYREVGTTTETLAEANQYNNHQPEIITDAAGQDTIITYNSLRQPETVTNALNETVTYDYSTTGLLERVISPDPLKNIAFTYDSYDRVSSATIFPEGYTIRLAYDAADRVTTVTYPDGTTDESVYDRLDLSKSKNRLGEWTQYLYGNMPGRPHAVVNPAGEMVQFDWCKCGALSRLVDAEGRITIFDYDVAGRLKSKELPDGTTTKYEYYPVTGRLKSQTDNKGQVTNITYTLDGKLSGLSVANVAPGTAPVAPISFEYNDPYNRISSRTDGVGTTSYTYHIIDPQDSVYGDGALASVDGPWANDTITYTYDELGRQIQRQINGSANTVSVDYDNLGRVESVTNPLGTFAYSYLPHTSMLAGISSPGGQTLFGYGSVQKDLRLTGITNLDSVDNPLSKFSYAHDAVGRITDWIQQENWGTSETYSAKYDKSSRLLEWAKSNSVEGKTRQWNWRFDRAGNRLSEQINKILDGVVARDQYSVNEADQITHIQDGGPLHVSGSLDEQGKIATGLLAAPKPTEADGSFSTWVDTDYTTGAYVTATDWSNNTTSTWVGVTPEPQPTHDFEYDANGNTIRVITTSADGLTTSEVTYEWDAWDQLVAINKSSHRSEFTYDGSGRRVKIKEISASGPAQEWWYLWDGLEIAEERGVSGNVWRMFFAQGEDYKTDTQTYYAKDHLGSIRQNVMPSQAMADNFSYDAYGTPEGQSLGSYNLQRLYTGHFYHVPSGLYLAPFRAYDPKLGRWIGRDPIAHNGGLNLYAYVQNHPLNLVDDDGLRPKAVKYDRTGNSELYDNSLTIGRGSEISEAIDRMESLLVHPEFRKRCKKKYGEEVTNKIYDYWTKTTLTINEGKSVSSTRHGETNLGGGKIRINLQYNNRSSVTDYVYETLVFEIGNNTWHWWNYTTDKNEKMAWDFYNWSQDPACQWPSKKP